MLPENVRAKVDLPRENQSKTLQEPVPVILDYHTVQRCMTEAIKDAMIYERNRRGNAVVMYIISLALIGGLAFHLLVASGKTIFEVGILLAVLFAVIQLCFLWWLFTRWL